MRTGKLISIVLLLSGIVASGACLPEGKVDDLTAQVQQINEAVGNLTTKVRSLTTEEGLKEIIRETQDGLQSIGFRHMVGRSLNDFFTAETRANARANVDEYWTSAGITVGPGSILSAHTRRVFNYPALMARIKLLPPDPDYSVHMGFQAGVDAGIGIFQLATEPMFPGYNLYLGTFANTAQIDVQNLLPAGYDTWPQTYVLKLNRHNAELWINHVLKGIILSGLREELPDWTDGPYALTGAIGPLASSMSAIISLDPETGTYSLEFDITRGHFVASDGDPEPPRQYALFSENTTLKWTDLAVGDGTTIVSHPIPIWGYSSKTLMWMATATISSATIEAYIDGAWRDSGITIPVDGTLNTIDIPLEAPIVRVKVIGGSGGGTVNLAEVYLR